MKLSIVIPVYNEAKTIGAVLKAVAQAPLLSSWEKEIIVVDDGSTDGTRDILKNYEREMRVIFKEKNEGKGSALKAGFKAASGDFILIQDADMEYSPADYPALLSPVENGQAEIVFGSRVLSRENNVSYSQFYFYGALLLTKIFNWFFGTKLTDFATCYKLFPARLVPSLVAWPGRDFVFDVVELTYELSQAGKIAEVPVRYRARSIFAGKKLNWRHGVKCMAAMLRIKFYPGK